MTTSEIISLARAKLLEEGDELLTDATLFSYANLSFKDVIKRVFPNNSILNTTINFTSGVGVLPSDFGTIYADCLDLNGNVFPEMSIADFARLQGAQRGVTIEGGQIKVSPDSTTSLTVRYYPSYPTLTSSVNPTIDEYFHELIVYGVIYRGFEDLQDVELSQFYKNNYETMLKEKSSHYSNYEEDSQRGGVMFNGINIIGGGVNNDPDRW